MIKIAHVEEVKDLTGLPQEVIDVITELAGILDSEYGEDRNVDVEDGGYVLILETVDEVEVIEETYLNTHKIIPEYVDKIIVEEGENYTNTLLILSSDFVISLIIPESITPKKLLEEANTNHGSKQKSV